MMSFGEIIRRAREEKKIILRKVAAELDIDQAIISKFERGERKPTKEQVLKFASFYDLNENELVIAWLSDKVVYDLAEEDYAQEALKAAEEKIQYIKSKKNE
ncbi:helix-turn-helix domain-containing protein [Tunicatimonas pelagia]|uniref:helix-turn-helix domain-containing protein n=1 Tax=Tunicatimonas pelagia TaxID=931531 RepID=UPI0026659BC0|nr:helix-turn-helix transcriptional regulator [Tunicatimonas pelagia]WKN40571.1 helix-turn-helix transcriptional regulator [Tunicatimonas pelagia]